MFKMDFLKFYSLLVSLCLNADKGEKIFSCMNKLYFAALLITTSFCVTEK